MFILRRIAPDYGEINTELGEYYVKVLKDENKEQFLSETKEWGDDFRNKIFGVVEFFTDHKVLMPLYNDSKQYIMTSDGHTFDNLSIRSQEE